MYGQKEIISCMVIVILVALLNYYKSIIRRDKEIQDARRTMLEKQKLDEQILEAQRIASNHAKFLSKMLEYKDRCYDIHALIYRPREYDSDKQIIDVNNSTEPDIDDGVGNIVCGRQTEKKELKGNENNINRKTTEKADSSSIVYVLVAVLLGSLVKAALDVTKHYKKKDNNETESDILRRCSLQEYSLLKHKRKNQPKAFEIFSRKSIHTQRSLDSSSKATLQQQDDFMRRMSGNPQDYSNGSGFTTTAESGTPVKSGQLLAGRPAPLLRRCSVPTFALNTNHQLRRPSMDSFSEEDVGAETKRRVRMIHRH